MNQITQKLDSIARNLYKTVKEIDFLNVDITYKDYEEYFIDYQDKEDCQGLLEDITYDLYNIIYI